MYIQLQITIVSRKTTISTSHHLTHNCNISSLQTTRGSPGPDVGVAHKRVRQHLGDRERPVAVRGLRAELPQSATPLQEQLHGDGRGEDNDQGPADTRGLRQHPDRPHELRLTDIYYINISALIVPLSLSLSFPHSEVFLISPSPRLYM